MADFRRYRVPGGTYFFTVNLLERRSDLLVRQIDSLREAVRATRQTRARPIPLVEPVTIAVLPFNITVLPDANLRVELVIAAKEAQQLQPVPSLASSLRRVQQALE